MKNLILIIIIALFLNNVKAQSWQWANSYQAGSSAFGGFITTDKNGNIYQTGYFTSSSITFDTITLTNTGGNDFFIVKYNSLGNVFWAKSVTGNSANIPYSISCDTLGNVYIAGKFNGTSITFGTITLTGNGSTELFIAKYDTNGNAIWAKKAGNTSYDDGYSVFVDNSNNVFLTGLMGGPTITFGGITLTSNGGPDIFIVKYNTNGTVIWAKNYGGASVDEADDITVDNFGNIYLTGRFGSPSIVFGSTTITNSYTSFYDYFIAKLDNNGNAVWAKSSGGQDSDKGNSICTDSYGNIFVTGYFLSSSIAFDTTTLNNSTTGTEDLFIVKYNSAGNVLWCHSYGNIKSDFGTDIIEFSDTFFLTGYFNSDSITFNNITMYNNTFNSTYDMFIANFDELGNVLSLKHIGGNSTDYANSITHDKHNNVYLGGTFSSNSITFGSHTLTNTAGRSFFIAKSCKIIDPLITINGSANICHGDSVILDAGLGYSTYEWSNGQTTQSIKVGIAGNYSVIVTNATGCSTISNSITINVFPIANAGPDLSICFGDSVMLSASGGITYTWNNGVLNGVSFVPAITTTYTVTVTDNNSCVDKDSLLIVVNPLPTTPIISLLGSVLYSNSISGNQWYNQDGSIIGATNQNFTPTINGDYYVVATINGCSSDTSNIIHVTITSIEQNELYNSIELYPNPITNEIIIEFKEINEKNKLNYEILNSIGQIVFKGTIHEKTIIQTTNFESGIYLIKFNNGKTFEFKKIVKE